jgi:hypothetical protein
LTFKYNEIIPKLTVNLDRAYHRQITVWILTTDTSNVPHPRKGIE